MVAFPGGLTVTRESHVELRFTSGCKNLGGKAVKVRFLRGWPDRIVLWPGGLIHFVELKKPDKWVYQPRQQRVHSWLRKMGFKVYVIKTKEEVDQYLQHMKERYELLS